MVSKHKFIFLATVAALVYAGSIICAYADPVTIAACRNPPDPSGFCITNTELTGLDEILKGTSAMYTLRITGTGAGAGRSLRFNVLSDSSDVPMVDDTPFVVTDDASGNWVFEFKFTLRCTADCLVVGPVAGSGVPSPTHITATIEESIAGEITRILDKSNTLTIECTTVPEPTTIMLLGTGLGTLAAWGSKRTRHRRSSPRS